MKVKIKRIDNSLPLPQYESVGACALDLSARIDMEIPAQIVVLIPLNVVIETPVGYMFTVVPRSSLPRKKNLSSPHGIGIIDQDFCGPEDEIHLQVFNFSQDPVTITKGERIAQGVFTRIDKVELEEIDEMKSETRGMFGSTEGYKE